MPTIEQHLDNIAEKLKRDEEFKGVGYDVQHYSSQFTKLMSELRQCRDVKLNINKVIRSFAPQGKELAKLAWRSFEMYGSWTTERREIADRLEEILTDENILNEAVESLLGGCECRKTGA